MFATASDRNVLTTQLQRLISMGCVPIAFCGAGRVLKMLRHEAGPGLARFDEHTIGVIDDDDSRRGSTCAGLAVISADEALTRGVKAVIITAEGAAQDALWQRRGRFLEAGARVLTCPERFAGQTWDDALIDHYEWSVAQKNGVGDKREYRRDYPHKKDATDPGIRGVLASRLSPGATICEIGSGSGKWTAEFIEQAGTYHCVDYSARLLHEVIEHRFAKHASKLRLHHDEHAKLAGVPDSSVDLVFSIDVFVHFKIDLIHQFLASIRRALKPQGSAILHFAAWNDAGIDRWEQCDTPHHNGGVGPIHSVHMDWLQTSARRLGLRCEKAHHDMGWAFMAEFRRA